MVDVGVSCDFGNPALCLNQLGYEGHNQKRWLDNMDVRLGIYELSKEITNFYKKKQRIVPFIGSGFSRNISDEFPDWEIFIEMLSKQLCNSLHYKLSCNQLSECKKNGRDNIKCRYLEDKFEEKLRATEYFVQRIGDKKKKGQDNSFDVGKEELRRILEQCFNPTSKICIYKKGSKEWEQHDLLMHNDKFKTFYTTNWDDALYQACNGYEKLLMERSTDFDNMRDTKKYEKIIIPFHGYYNTHAGDSLICCETDYFNRISRETAYEIKLKSDLLHNNFLFLGYSFNDININYLLYQINLLFQKPMGSIYWLTTDYRDSELVEFFKKRNISVYSLLTEGQENELKALEIQLKKICEKCEPDNYKIKEKKINKKKQNFFKDRTIKFLKAIK